MKKITRDIKYICATLPVTFDITYVFNIMQFNSMKTPTVFALQIYGF